MSTTPIGLNYDFFFSQVKAAASNPNAEQSLQALAFRCYQNYNLSDFFNLARAFKEKNAETMTFSDLMVHATAANFLQGIMEGIIKNEMDLVQQCADNEDMEGLLQAMKKLSPENAGKIPLYKSLIEQYMQTNDPSLQAFAKRLYADMPESPEKAALQHFFAATPETFTELVTELRTEIKKTDFLTAMKATAQKLILRIDRSVLERLQKEGQACKTRSVIDPSEIFPTQPSHPGESYEELVLTQITLAIEKKGQMDLVAKIRQCIQSHDFLAALTLARTIPQNSKLSPIALGEIIDSCRSSHPQIAVEAFQAMPPSDQKVKYATEFMKNVTNNIVTPFRNAGLPFPSEKEIEKTFDEQAEIAKKRFERYETMEIRELESALKESQDKHHLLRSEYQQVLMTGSKKEIFETLERKLEEAKTQITIGTILERKRAEVSTLDQTSSKTEEKKEGTPPPQTNKKEETPPSQTNKQGSSCNVQ